MASLAAGTMIETAVQDLKVTVEEITAACAEQARAIEQVGITVLEMDGVTQQNSALVEESSSAAASLREQAITLLDSVAVFKLDLKSHSTLMVPQALGVQL